MLMIEYLRNSSEDIKDLFAAPTKNGLNNDSLRVYIISEHELFIISNGVDRDIDIERTEIDNGTFRTKAYDPTNGVFSDGDLLCIIASN